MSGKPQKIEIRGYASRGVAQGDSTPAATQARLAYRRCQQTMQYLVQSGIRRDRIRLGIVDLGDAKSSGNKNLTRRQFDRVEIVMVNELTSEFIGTEEEQNQRFFGEGGKTQQP